ncbi:MAG: IS21 family transposase [Sedimenticola sp.]
MRNLRDVVRMILTTDISNRQIAKLCGVSRTTVIKYRARLAEMELGWADVENSSDSGLESLFRSKPRVSSNVVQPNFGWVHREMQYRGVTLLLLWEEYALANPGRAYSYSQFTHYYREYKGKIDLVMRQNHRAGEVTYVDFAGRTIPWTDKDTGETHKAQLFVAVLGCSKFTFLYAVPSQKLRHWIEAHNAMLAYIGGVTEVICSDNLKSAVIKAGAEPELNRTYREFAKHYGTVIVPTRVRRPKDKALAELGVKLAYRWVLAKLRHRKFFSIEEINQAIGELLEAFNNRPFQKLPGSRRTRFEELDKPLLRSLPSDSFEYAEWTPPYKVGPDYHVRINQHFYSVPHELVAKRVEARVTSKGIEILHDGKRVAFHVRSDEVGGHTTNPQHQPKAHRAYASQKPALVRKWAKSIGPNALLVIEHQFESRKYELLALKSCSTLQRLAKSYGKERFEAACTRAVQICSLTPKSVRSILQHRLDAMDPFDRPVQVNLPLHDNVRGAAYYAQGGQ